MELIHKKTVECNGCKVFLLGIEVQDYKSYIDQVIEVISDTGWIRELDEITAKSFSANVERTTSSLVEVFKNNRDSQVNGDVGEYIVSLSSLDSLERFFSHLKIPISELWKERVSGNGSFDFHTVTEDKRLNFGEAKYKSTGNPYTDAAKQVSKFRAEKKDESDLFFLKEFKQVKDNTDILSQANYSYTISFSLSGANPKNIMNNTLESESVLNLTKEMESLFIIGVSIVSP